MKNLSRRELALGALTAPRLLAAGPLPKPTAAQVAITRVDAKAMCVAEIFRPANIRFSSVLLTQQRRGMS